MYLPDRVRLHIANASISVAQQPTNSSTCPSGSATFSVTAAGTGPFTYQWQWRRTNGQFANILEGINTDPQGGPITFTASGARTGIVTIENIGGGGTAGSHWEQRCVVTNACGSVTSNPATLTICIADTDDGSNTGTCDGGVTIDDLLYYLFIFEEGAIAADVDDGSGTGTPDGGVTIDDLLYFLQRFESGC